MFDYIIASFILALASLAIVVFGLSITLMMMSETKWYSWFSFSTIKKYFKIIYGEVGIKGYVFMFVFLFVINLFIAFTQVMPNNEIKKKYGISASVECKCMCLSCYENCVALNALKSGDFEFFQIADGKTNSLGKIILKIPVR